MVTVILPQRRKAWRVENISTNCLFESYNYILLYNCIVIKHMSRTGKQLDGTPLGSQQTAQRLLTLD